jgi:hypothetical protein
VSRVVTDLVADANRGAGLFSGWVRFDPTADTRCLHLSRVSTRRVRNSLEITPCRVEGFVVGQEKNFEHRLDLDFLGQAVVVRLLPSINQDCDCTER